MTHEQALRHARELADRGIGMSVYTSMAHPGRCYVVETPTPRRPLSVEDFDMLCDAEAFLVRDIKAVAGAVR